MINNLYIRNFRSLKDVTIQFEPDLTVLVGKNDSGKTSVIDALKLVFENSVPEPDDFHWDTREIRVDVELDDITIIRAFKLIDDNEIHSETKIRFSEHLLNSIRSAIKELEGAEDEAVKEQLIEYGKKLGISLRRNMRVVTMVDKLNERIAEIRKGNYTIEVENSPVYPIYFLDGRHFEDISRFFREVFFKEISMKIWDYDIDGKRIRDLITEKLEEYAQDIEQDIQEKGILEKIRTFLPDVERISIKPLFEPRGINMGINVQLLERGDREVSINKKGDGTKRRITMALLEYKKSEKDLPTLYIFDEPDTHLHVRAQIDLIRIIQRLSREGKQVIITTHSPFIINSVSPIQIRLLSLKNSVTTVRQVRKDKEIEKILANLGIANIELFFSRVILIVEGETEEKFIPTIFMKTYGRTLQSSLIKLINRKGITDIPRFAEVISKFVHPNDIFILMDNDASPETRDLITKLEIPKENVFMVGTKEFEDAFEPEVIYNAWKNFVEDRGKRTGERWTVVEISKLREESIKHGGKFSKKLRELNAGCPIGLTKPKLASALAEYCTLNQIPREIQGLLKILNEK